MKAIQKTIDKMYDGDIDVIINNISAEVPFVVLNAIIAGTTIKLRDNHFIEGVKKAEDNNTVLLGLPVSKVATASLHLLGEKKYSGNDSVIKQLIDTKFKM